MRHAAAAPGPPSHPRRRPRLPRAHCEKDAQPLGLEIIHSVTNPVLRLTGAIHVYGSYFFAVPRSEWDAETLLKRPCEGERMARSCNKAGDPCREAATTPEQPDTSDVLVNEALPIFDWAPAWILSSALRHKVSSFHLPEAIS